MMGEIRATEIDDEATTALLANGGQMVEDEVGVHVFLPVGSQHRGGDEWLLPDGHIIGTDLRVPAKIVLKNER